jgi:voltage-gated potassium channel
MSPRQLLLRILYTFLTVIAIGVIGYMSIEGWPFLDALFMTIITLSTVGYNEVHSLSMAGKAFSIVLIVGGVGVTLYTLTAIVQYFTATSFANILWRRRMKDQISKLKRHYILCGYGRVGQEVARVFRNEHIPFVIIDANQEATAKASSDGYLYLHGSATSDDVLNTAGIKQARGLITTLGSDADNLYITLSAKEMNPGVFVVARATGKELESKLRRAGADRIILPETIGGRRMAIIALRPLVVDFVDTTLDSRGGDLILENVKVLSGSPVEGLTLKEGLICCGGATILAVKKKDGRLLANPRSDTRLELEDDLIVIGTRDQLRTLEGVQKD